MLLGEPVVKDKIREGVDTDLPEIIVGSKESGMCNFNMSLAELVEKDMIFADTAMEYSPNRDQLKGMLHGIKTSAQALVHRVKRVATS